MKGIFGWLSERFREANRRLAEGETAARSAGEDPVDGASALEAAGRALDNEELRPISIERMGLLFDSQGWKWELDDEGDIASGWDGHMVFFRLAGAQHEVLNIVAFRHGVLPREARSELLFLIEEWHRDHLWPKCYFREVEGDALQVMAELNIDFEPGVTDAQLVLQFRCAIGTILQFFAELDEAFGRAEGADEDEG